MVDVQQLCCVGCGARHGTAAYPALDLCDSAAVTIDTGRSHRERTSLRHLTRRRGTHHREVHMSTGIPEASVYDAIGPPRDRGKGSASLHEVKPISLVVGLINELRS